MKSTPDQIRDRFDREVERFSNLETGQIAIMDAVVLLEIVTQAAQAVTPKATHLLDIGCGGGNFTLRLLQRMPQLNCTLLDLSRPMLDRARQRVSAATSGAVTTIQSDIRSATFDDGAFDIILAGSSLHHLRGDHEWKAVFKHFHRWLRPGGAVWISDMIEQNTAAVEAMMKARWGEYLVKLKSEQHRDNVFAYVDGEDTPRPIEFQLHCLRAAGFSQTEILHKNALFAAFGAIR